MHGPLAGWEVVRPSSPGRVAGTAVAGFRSRTAGPVDVRVVPHPALTVALAFGDGPLVVDTATGRQQRGSLVTGFLHGAVRVRGKSVECVQVRLSPLVARAVLGSAASELGRTVVALDDVWGRDAACIEQRLGETPSWEGRFVVVEALLARRARAGPAVEPEVARVWDRIVAGRGRVRVEGLAAEVGWSRRRLWSRFRSQIGLSPKRAAMLVRFDRAARLLAAGGGAAAVAADSGYADQPHLHRDFVAFTGTTPSAAINGPWMAVEEIAWAGHGTNACAIARRPRPEA